MAIATSVAAYLARYAAIPRAGQRRSFNPAPFRITRMGLRGHAIHWSARRFV